MFWTVENTLRLRDMWDEGYTGAEIAAKLGCTRSAVLGKVHRMQLPSRLYESRAPFHEWRRARELERRARVYLAAWVA